MGGLCFVSSMPLFTLLNAAWVPRKNSSKTSAGSVMLHVLFVIYNLIDDKGRCDLGNGLGKGRLSLIGDFEVGRDFISNLTSVSCSFSTPLPLFLSTCTFSF